MRHPNLQFIATSIALVFLFGLPITTEATAKQNGNQVTHSSAHGTKQEKALIAGFDKSVKEYLALRESVRKKLPPLSKDATPEQIATYQKAFVDALRAQRSYAKPGYIFSAPVADYIRTLIKTEFKGTDRAELRETILEADTAGVPLRVNYPYPENKELAQMPPTLLLRIPQLPKEVKYRFVKSNLLLVDTDNGLIVDYMTNALP